jgi:3-oxoacyl-(acyl-carrier-protein) synthase
MNNAVVTGLGVVSPIGSDLKTFEDNLYLGASGAKTIDRFPPAALPTKIGMQVPDFKSDFRDVKISYALDAAHQAMNDSFGDDINSIPNESRLSIGIGLELFSVEDLIALKNETISEEEKNSLTFLNTPSDLCCHLISKKYHLNLSPLIHISACAAGSDAIGSGLLQIRRKKSKVVLAGGTDSMINPMGLAGFCRIGAMTKKNETPLLASRPFDRDRDGFVLGEGAAFIVLEDEEHAIKRGAHIYAKISGQGNSLDAYSISDPHPEGKGAVRCMSRALEDAGLKPEDIDAVSCHGTGTPKNDPAEASAIRSLFKNNWQDLPIFATKSLIGHCISAAGAIETVASVIALKRQELHRTLNLENIDTLCELDHIIDKNRKKEINHIIKNSFGFGGQNASLIISRFE